MKNPKLLFLAQTFPFPPTGGVTLRTFNILRQLAEDYDITLIAFDRRRSPPEEPVPVGDLKAVEPYSTARVFKIPQHLARTRFLADHVQSVLRQRVYTVYRLYSREFMQEVDMALGISEPNLIHLDSLDLSATLPMLPPHRVAVTHHNVESELLERRAEFESNVIRRSYFRFQARLQVREEVLWCPRVALNVTVSERDSAELASRAGSGAFYTAPNGVDTEFFSPGETRAADQEGVVFVGGTTWFPNRDALEYFATEIHPLLRRKAPGVEVNWVGRATAKEADRFRGLGIAMTGFVDDIRPYVRRSACFVLPFRVGGGTRLKLLDAWAMGKAIVSTSSGAEGVDARDGENILIRDDPEDFANAVAEVLGDSELREHLGRGARETAETSYSWDRIGRGLRRAYADLV